MTVSRLFAVLALIATSASAAMPASANDQAPVPESIAIGTGPLQSVYYLTGNAICRILIEEEGKRGRHARCGAETTTGSLANLDALRAKSLDFALIQSDIAQQAVKGAGPFKDRPFDDLRILFSLHTEPFQLLVPRNLGLKSFEELKGRKINIGKSGTAPNEMFLSLMKIHGLTDSSFTRVLHTPAAEQFSAFCDGDIEALGMMTGTPNAAYAGAISDCGGSLLSFDTEVDRRMIEDTPYYRPIVIPKDTYAGLDQAVTTFGVVTVAVAPADVPDETAYRIVRDVFERIESLKAMHPALGGLDPAHMVSDGITAPLHPGAMRYFKEKGLIGVSRSP